MHARLDPYLTVIVSFFINRTRTLPSHLVWTVQSKPLYSRGVLSYTVLCDLVQ